MWTYKLRYFVQLSLVVALVSSMWLSIPAMAQGSAESEEDVEDPWQTQDEEYVDAQDDSTDECGEGVEETIDGVAGYWDVFEGTWYSDAVQWSVDDGITDILGFCFGPNNPVSRGETAVWIHNMENRPVVSEPHSFTDVTDDSQYDAIAWMANTGITTGTSPTTFGPDETLTRAQAATFLHRLAGKPSAPPHNFDDVLAAWQQGGVSWMAHTGITTGTTPTTFAPDGTLTRAQLITFLYRYQNNWA